LQGQTEHGRRHAGRQPDPGERDVLAPEKQRQPDEHEGAMDQPHHQLGDALGQRLGPGRQDGLDQTRDQPAAGDIDQRQGRGADRRRRAIQPQGARRQTGQDTHPQQHQRKQRQIQRRRDDRQPLGKPAALEQAGAETPEREQQHGRQPDPPVRLDQGFERHRSDRRIVRRGARM